MSKKGFAHFRYQTVESLVSDYNASYPSAPYTLPVYANNEEDAFSFGLIHFLYYYVDMYHLTNDSSWVSLACDTIDHIINNNDVSRASRSEITITPLQNPYVAGNYYQAPYPYAVNGTPVEGWSSFDGNGGTGLLRTQILQDGQITGAIAAVADLILDNPVTLSSFVARANSYFAHIKLVIDSHNNSWRYNKVSSNPAMTVEGNWYYPERLNGTNSVYSTILAFNHSAGACQAMLLYDKYFTDSEYVNKVNNFLYFTRQSICRQELGEGYYWPYTIENISVSEDLNHGSYTFIFFYYAYINGYGSFTVDELTRYCKSSLNAWLEGKVGSVAEKFDGGGTMPVGEAFDPAHFSWLIQFDTDLFKMVRDLTATNYISNYPRTYRAYSSMFRFKPSGIIF